MNRKVLLLCLIAFLLAGLSNITAPPSLDANVWRIDTNHGTKWSVSNPMPSFSYASDGNLTIDFNVATDTNYGTTWADINYSLTNTQGSGTQIVKGLVVDGNKCQTNFIGDWNNHPNSDTNLIGYWKFDENATSKLWDFSGNGNNGTYYNGADSNATGKWDTNAAWFDGINDYIEISAAQDMNDLNGSFTLSTWFNANGSQNKGAEILSRTGFFWIGYDYTGNLEFALRDQNTDQNYYSLDNVYRIKRITTTITNNQWNQATASSDGTNISLYLNGALQASGTVKQTLNPYCIDQYEASRSDATFCGNDVNWSYPGDCNTHYGTLATPASAPNRIPWTTVSQTAAKTACTAAGKYLCSSSQWMAAANLNGQVYDLNDTGTRGNCVVDSLRYCLDHSQTAGEACNTGSNINTSPSNCKSSQGVYDMIGNVWEWTSDVVDVNTSAIATNYPNDAVSPNLWGNGTKSLHYGNDAVYTGATKTGRAVARGGDWAGGGGAGLFCVSLYNVPTNTSSTIGFRCCDTPQSYNVCDANMAFINPSIKLGYDTNAFKGNIEETKLYHKALTAAQILLDYDLGARNFRTCSYDWNISGISDANYYANVLVRDDAGNSDYNSSNNNFRVNASTNTAPDLNIWQVDGYDFNAALPAFSYARDGNLAIRFRASDAENNDLNFNMWYGATSGAKTSKIIGDINLSTETGHGNCDTNSKAGMVCAVDWNTSGIVDSNYWIAIELNDGTDTNTMPSAKSFMVDNTAPTTKDNDFNNTWQNTDANIQFSCSDGSGSGCKNFYYSLDDTNYQTSWKTDSNRGIVLASDGNHEIFYWSDDLVDNNASAKLIYLAIDKTPPTTIDNDFNNGWNNSDQNIQLKCTDTNSGCKNLYYSLNDTNHQNGWGIGDVNIGISTTGLADGNHAIFYWSDDNATGIGDNNEAAHLIYIAIDKAAPTTSNSHPTNGWSSVDVNVNFSCSDANAGCKNFYYSLDDANRQAAWGYDKNIGINLTTDGNHGIWFWSDDKTTGIGDNNENAQLMHVAIRKTVPPTPPAPGGNISEGSVANPPSRGGGGAPAPPPVPCKSDSDCSEGYRCVSEKCAKFFDVKIVRADTPIKAGEVFDFVYLLKNPLGKPIDAEVEYWLEKDGKKAVEGREVMFIDRDEEKEFESNLILLDSMLGKYSFVVQLAFEGTKVFATKDIEVKTSVPLALDLHISRLPSEIKTGPLSIEVFVGTNRDERTSVRVNQTIMKGNEIVWKSDEQVQVKASEKIAVELPALPPGEYKLVITVAGQEGATASIIRNFIVESRMFEGPTVEDIMKQKSFEFSIIALLLSIAAILSWHNLIVIRFISPDHPARTRIKFVYFTVFALAFFLLLGFTIWSMSDLLKEFTLNEFYRFMESPYGIALQQIAANAWNYLASTTIGQQIAGLLRFL